MNKLKKPTAQQFANWLGHDLETVNAAISAVQISDPDAAYTTAEDMGHEEIAEVISEIYFEYGSLKEALIACAEDLAEGLNESSKRKTRLREEEEPYIQVIPKKLDIYHEVILPMEKAFKNLKVDEILRTHKLTTKDKIYYEGYNNGVDTCIKKIRNFDIYSNKDPKVVLNELYNSLEKISRSSAGTDHPFHYGFLRASGKCKDIFYEEVMEKFVFDK
jgi:hypothetical protein